MDKQGDREYRNALMEQAFGAIMELSEEQLQWVMEQMGKGADDVQK